MRTALGLFSIALVATTARADNPSPPQPQKQRADPPAAAQTLMDHAKMLDPIQVDSLTLTPIVTTDDKAGAAEQMIVLDEAMPKKLVRIKEVEGGSVNSLTLTNNANQPLFLLAGEVIIGGKQDRIIGRNTIVTAKTTQEVPVFCVEHGRWTEQTTEFASAKALAHGRLRGNASFASQQDVWAEVHTKNGQRKTSNDTDTYRKVAQQQTDGTLAAMQKKVDAGLAKLTDDQRANLVGYAVSLNGQVATVDVFQSPSLFGKLQSKLVRSYLTEAVDLVAEKNVKPPTEHDVKTFMDDAQKAQDEDSYETTAGSTKINKGHYAAKARVEYKKAAPAAPKGPVYETYTKMK
jgi:hypothetical protein